MYAGRDVNDTFEIDGDVQYMFWLFLFLVCVFFNFSYVYLMIQHLRADRMVWCLGGPKTENDN